jgi:hypothetical protein
MPMLTYPVMCQTVGCQALAAFKIAAHWKDGITDELKTYSLTCAECLPKSYEMAVAKCASCRLAPGETLDKPGIYELNRGERDQTLKRRTDLER